MKHFFRAGWALAKIILETFQIIGQAVIEIAFSDREQFEVPAKTESFQEKRLRREQELIQKFKTSQLK